MIHLILTRRGQVFADLLISPWECTFWCEVAQRNGFGIDLQHAPLE